MTAGSAKAHPATSPPALRSRSRRGRFTLLARQRRPRRLLRPHEASESPHPGLDLFSVAPRSRIALLGICHLCIDSSCTTTAKQGIPRQILGMNICNSSGFNAVHIVLYLMLPWHVSRYKVKSIMRCL